MERRGGRVRRRWLVRLTRRAVGVHTVQLPAREQGKRGPAGGGWASLWLEAPSERGDAPDQPGGATLCLAGSGSGGAAWCEGMELKVGHNLLDRSHVKRL